MPEEKDLFDLSSEAFREYIIPLTGEAVQKAPDQQAYLSYPSPEGIPGRFIHEYKNGRRVLIEIDEDTGKAHFLKEL